MNIVAVAKYLYREIAAASVALLPNDIISTRIRRVVLNTTGLRLAENVLIYRNVMVIGCVTIGRNSSVSNNTSINGARAGITIGANVMIAPGCCIVAFDHGTEFGTIPMIQQPLIERPIVIGDDVWIAANCTITKGVTIGTGAIIGANSVVTKDVPPFGVAAGVPARLIKFRNEKE